MVIKALYQGYGQPHLRVDMFLIILPSKGYRAESWQISMNYYHESNIILTHTARSNLLLAVVSQLVSILSICTPNYATIISARSNNMIMFDSSSILLLYPCIFKSRVASHIFESLKNMFDRAHSPSK